MRRGALGLVFVLSIAACGRGGPAEVELSRSPDAPTPSVVVRAVDAVAETPPTTATTVAVPAAPTTAPPSPTTAAPPVVAAETAPRSPIAVAASAIAATGRATPWTVQPYLGFGAWLDAFDWSPTFARSPDHVVGPEAVDHMAAEGVQTIYIQASRWNSETDIIDPGPLQAIIDRAHGHGMSVIGWYLPTLEDPATDLRRILAVAALDIDGVAIDIEARNVSDVAERNRRLVQLSADLRGALPDKAIGGIVLEPVLIEDVNANYWPDFPWMGSHTS